MYYLAIDIGASSGRHILGEYKEGKLTLKEIYRFSNGAVKRGGKLVWDVEELFKNIVAGLKECGNLGVVPYSVGIDTWGVDYALLDGDGKLISEVFSYRDDRTSVSMLEAEKVVPFKKLYEITGIQRAQYNTVYQLYADKISGKLQKAETMLSIPDYLHYLLSGVKKNEYTHASTSGLLDAKTGDWSWELIDALGYPRKIFGKLYKPGEVVGNLKEDIAKEVGFNTKVVFPPSHDTASAVMAVPAIKGQPLYISSGTWSLLGTELSAPITNEEAYKFNATNEGGYAGTIRFLRNITGMWTIQSVKKELGGKYSYDDLMNLAIECKSTGSIVNLNDDRFLAPDSMIEAIKGYCAEYGLVVPQTVGEIMDVIYRSLASIYAETIKMTETVTGKTFEVLNIVGGGSKDGYLNKLTKEYTGKRVLAGPTEGTAVGNLLAQIISAGEIKDLPEARMVVKNSFAVIEI
ncbi:MAG: rhamnulokinase [Clostridia bacterium]|nr:rhamnulokinase [Clostridia bacterium]